MPRATIQDLGRQSDRDLHGNKVFNSGALAIDANPNDVETTAAVNYTIKGIFYQLAAQAAIDLSTLTGLPTTALADGYTQIFGLEVNAAGTISVVYGEQISTAAITAGTQELDWPVASSTSTVVFAAVKVGNASGSDFTFGTTSLATAGVTDTYYNLSGGGSY